MTNYNRQMFTISDFGFGIADFRKEKNLILNLAPLVLTPET